MSDKLTPAEPRDLADAIAFALRFEGRKRVHQADEYMAAIAAERVVRHLERAGFVVMKRPPEVGAAALGRGFKANRGGGPVARNRRIVLKNSDFRFDRN